MSYDSIEKSTAASQAFELYQFQTAGETFFLTSAAVSYTHLTLPTNREV